MMLIRLTAHLRRLEDNARAAATAHQDNQIKGVLMLLDTQDYHSLASDAALLECRGLFEQARTYWLMAAAVAGVRNRQWANTRALVCEKRHEGRATWGGRVDTNELAPNRLPD